MNGAASVGFEAWRRSPLLFQFLKYAGTKEETYLQLVTAPPLHPADLHEQILHKWNTAVGIFGAGLDEELGKDCTMAFFSSVLRSWRQHAWDPTLSRYKYANLCVEPPPPPPTGACSPPSFTTAPR